MRSKMGLFNLCTIKDWFDSLLEVEALEKECKQQQLVNLDSQEAIQVFIFLFLNLWSHYLFIEVRIGMLTG